MTTTTPRFRTFGLGLGLVLSTTFVAGLGAGCLEGPPPTRATTRLCPDQADGDPMCFQQCVDPVVLDCTVMDGEGTEVPECAHDEATGAYLFTDDAYVPPEDGTVCFALLADADDSTLDANDDIAAACEDDDKKLQVVVQGAADEVCYDVNCGINDDCG
jgi:hypothetical protein